MFDKLFGPAPHDLDEKHWKLHWLGAFAAIGAVLFIVALIYLGWNVAVDQSPGNLN